MVTIKQKARILDKLILHAETIEKGDCVEMKALTWKDKVELHHQTTTFLSIVRSELAKVNTSKPPIKNKR